MKRESTEQPQNRIYDKSQHASGDTAAGSGYETSDFDLSRSIEEAVRRSTPKRAPIKLTKKTPSKIPPLTIEQILEWADAYHAAAGAWPNRTSGTITGMYSENWSKVENALKKGLRTLPGGSSLARLLAEYRGVRNSKGLPSLSVEQILQWADAFRERMGCWPTEASGRIEEAPLETWNGVTEALRNGGRGLPGGTTLPRLLAEQRGVRNRGALPSLSVEQILKWADAYREQVGVWPTCDSGTIDAAPWNESWRSVDLALNRGLRGLQGGSSVPRLLAEQRGVPHKHDIPPLSIPQILAWADDWHRRHGKWPRENSVPVFDGANDTWKAVQCALVKGLRGLSGGSSVARLLAAHRGVVNRMARPPITQAQILEWADRHKERTGGWPTRASGQIAEVPEGTWSSVNAALYHGCRGLPGGSSLAELLADERGHRVRTRIPKLTEAQILQWADAHHARTGTWPAGTGGPITGEPGETWKSVNTSLELGRRGLSGRSSLARLLNAKRGARNRKALPDLTEAQILAWAVAHRNRTGSWPTSYSGPIKEAPGERWKFVDTALRYGVRGLPGKCSLARLLRAIKETARGPGSSNRDRIANED